MLTSRELLAAVRAAQGIESNYRLARVLDVPEKSVQRWNTGKNTPDDATAVKLAEMAGFDPAEVLAAMYAQRSAGSALAPVWESIARRLERGAATAAGVILTLCISGTPDGGAHLEKHGETAHVDSGFTLYTLWRLLCSRSRNAARGFLAAQFARTAEFAAP